MRKQFVETVHNWEYQDINGKAHYGLKTITLWQIAITAFREVIENKKTFTPSQLEYLKLQMIGRGYEDVNPNSVQLYTGNITGKIVRDRLKKSKSLQNDINIFRAQFGMNPVKF